MKDKAVALHAGTANVAVAEQYRHYIGSCQLYALTAVTRRERPRYSMRTRLCAILKSWKLSVGKLLASPSATSTKLETSGKAC